MVKPPQLPRWLPALGFVVVTVVFFAQLPISWLRSGGHTRSAVPLGQARRVRWWRGSGTGSQGCSRTTSSIR
jgi:hypothetical protein